MTELFKRRDTCGDKIGKSRETNWLTVMTGIGLTIAIWAAAIHPLEKETERQRSDAAEIAKAVLKQNELFSELRHDVTKHDALQIAMKADIARMGSNGTAGTSLRRGEIGAKVMDALAEVNNIRSFGSPVTDRRLAILEFKGGIPPPPRPTPASE